MNKLISIFTCVISFSSLAQAKDNNAYFGVNIGQSSYDVGSDLAFTSPTDKDEEDTSFKVFGGYQLNSHFSLVASYIDLGESSSNFIGSADLNPGITKFNRSIEVSGYALSVKAQYPINSSFYTFAEVGAFSWENEYNKSVEITNGESSTKSNGKDTDDGVDIFYGLGVGYKWNNIDVTVGYEIYTIDSADVDVASVGFIYHF